MPADASVDTPPLLLRRADRALSRAEGNISQAAKLLGISRPTLYDLMKYHNIKVD